jgi:hypothetical protein
MLANALLPLPKLRRRRRSARRSSVFGDALGNAVVAEMQPQQSIPISLGQAPSNFQTAGGMFPFGVGAGFDAGTSGAGSGSDTVNAVDIPTDPIALNAYLNKYFGDAPQYLVASLDGAAAPSDSDTNTGQMPQILAGPPMSDAQYVANNHLTSDDFLAQQLEGWNWLAANAQTGLDSALAAGTTEPQVIASLQFDVAYDQYNACTVQQEQGANIDCGPPVGNESANSGGVDPTATENGAGLGIGNIATNAMADSNGLSLNSAFSATGGAILAVNDPAATGSGVNNASGSSQTDPSGLTQPSATEYQPYLNLGQGIGIYLGGNSATNALYTNVPASGSYREIAGTMPDFQAHHLNQGAVYNSSFPYRSGQSILMQGNAITDAGSPHFEAHASLENWWTQYREGGDLYGQRPTNSQYGQALNQSLLDAGLSPSDADKYAEIARQQRIANGAADNMSVSKIPKPLNQSGTNVVNADLWAARGLANNIAIVGKAATVVGAGLDAYSLYSQYQISSQTGNYSNTYSEGIRIAGGWTGAEIVGGAFGEFGAEAGLVFGGPFGAVIGGVAGGIIGGGIGYFLGGQLSKTAATDVIGLPPPSTSP